MPASKLAHLQLPDGPERWQTVIPVVEELKEKAKKLGLWNLFLSKLHYPEFGVPLTNLEVCSETVFSTCGWVTDAVGVQYAVMAEMLGYAGYIASESVNCSAPDTGNMGQSQWFPRGWFQADSIDWTYRGARSVWKP